MYPNNLNFDNMKKKIASIQDTTHVQIHITCKGTTSRGPIRAAKHRRFRNGDVFCSMLWDKTEYILFSLIFNTKFALVSWLHPAYITCSMQVRVPALASIFLKLRNWKTGKKPGGRFSSEPPVGPRFDRFSPVRWRGRSSALNRPVEAPVPVFSG